MNPTIIHSETYQRFDNFYRQYASMFQVVTGALLIAVATFLAVIAVMVFNQESSEANQRHKEATTVRLACERARVFGPPFILHIQRVEDRLHLGALEAPVEYPLGSGKKVDVLDFYRSTIPKNCPH